MNLEQITRYAQDSELVIMDNERPVTTSLKVAEYFDKEHKHVIRDIREKIVPYVSESFNQSNFGLVEYTDAKGEERPMYILTRDGFTMVAMGYTGVKAMKFKEDYITAFNKMEEALRGVQLTPEQLVDRAASKVANQLFPQFMKTVNQTLSKSIVEQIRGLPQGETLLQLQEAQATQKPKTKARKRIMKYTLHTWEIEYAENGPIATNKKEFETTDHNSLMERLKSIMGTGTQYVVNREMISTVA